MRPLSETGAGELVAVLHDGGTLGIIVASSDGLVVATDKRQTLDNYTFCDGVSDKILESTIEAVSFWW
jgi:hypothetical protein